MLDSLFFTIRELLNTYIALESSLGGSSYFRDGLRTVLNQIDNEHLGIEWIEVHEVVETRHNRSVGALAKAENAWRDDFTTVQRDRHQARELTLQGVERGWRIVLNCIRASKSESGLGVKQVQTGFEVPQDESHTPSRKDDRLKELQRSKEIWEKQVEGRKPRGFIAQPDF